MTTVKKNKNKDEINTNVLSDEEILEIKKKDLFNYATKMTETKEAHKNNSIKIGTENYRLKEENNIYKSQYESLKNRYQDLQKEINELQSRIKNKKVHKLDTFDDIVIMDINKEIQSADEDAKNNYTKIREKNINDFMKQFI